MPSDPYKPSFAPRTAPHDDHNQQLPSWNDQRWRYVLILTGLIGLAGIGSLLIWEGNDTMNIQVSSPHSDLTAKSKSFRLEGATYKGNTADGDEYVLFADAATEDADRQGIIEMVAPRAQLDQPDQQSVTIRSNDGIYYANDKELSLTGRVVIVQPDTGYTLYTDAAHALLDEGIVESTNDVHGYGPDSMITAKGMIISKPDNNVIFTGKSALVIEEAP
ncbi:MAG: LPS export ABC transporter periplasmic protein LptC [Candidatus Puniceispirillales bacterium]